MAKATRKDYPQLSDRPDANRMVSVSITRLYHWMELLDNYGHATHAWLARQSIEDVCLMDLAQEIEASLLRAKDTAEEAAIIKKLMDADGDVW